jgi:CheY-like chemotaxis protein
MVPPMARPPVERELLSTAIPGERTARILVVEDEGIVRLDIQEKLEQLGYMVAGAAASSDEALHLVESKRPDLVLMDVRLEGSRDGIQTAEQVRQRWDVPIVFLTAHGDAETMVRIKGTNPFGYLLKPFEAKDLLTVIEIALYRHRMERRLHAATGEMELRAKRAGAIAGLGLAALHGATFAELGEMAVTLLPKNLDAGYGLLLSNQGPSGPFRVETAAGPGGPPRGLLVNGPLLDQVARTGKPAQGEPGQGESGQVLPDAKTCLCVCVEGGRGSWGILAICAGDALTYNEADVDYLQSIANVLSSALQSEEAQGLILQLSTPVLPLDEGLMLVPLVGEMDEERTAHFSGVLLEAIRRYRARAVVVDVTGLGRIESAFAAELARIVDKAAMLGAEAILCGISTGLAEEMVTRSVALNSITVAGDLRSAIDKARARVARTRRTV